MTSPPRRFNRQWRHLSPLHDVAKITGGTLHTDRIPNLPVAKVDGLQTALDGKLNTSGGTITGTLSFGSSHGQRLNLGATGAGIGIQSYTQYFRTYRNFAWYKGGEHTDGELKPGTNGTVQMVIKDGHVGIGTNDPGTDRLRVQGNASIAGNLHVGPGSSAIAPSRVNAVCASTSGDAGIAIAQNSGVNVLVQASGVGGYIGTTSNHPLVFRTNGQDRMVIDTNGNVRVNGTIYMANPLRHRMYPANPQVYQDIFAARDTGVISKLGNPTYDDTTYQTNPWNDRRIIKYGGNNEQDGHGAKVVIPAGYNTVWVRALGERWNVVHAYFLDDPREDLGQWTGGYRAANCYCPNGSLSDSYYNVTQWLPIPAGRAGELALISKPQTDKEFWLSGVAFSKNPWAYAAQAGLGYHWQVNGGDQVPWNTHNWNDDVLAKIPPKINLRLKVPVVPNKRDKLLYLIEHNSNWNGCMHTAIMVNNSPIERFLATYDNLYARHWNSKSYARYIAARIPAALIPDGSRYPDVRIDMSMERGANDLIFFGEIITHDLEIPATS